MAERIEDVKLVRDTGDEDGAGSSWVHVVVGVAYRTSAFQVLGYLNQEVVTNGRCAPGNPFAAISGRK